MRLYAAILHSATGVEKNVKPLFPRKEMTLPAKLLFLHRTQLKNQSEILSYLNSIVTAA
jgi:hypothetical protein